MNKIILCATALLSTSAIADSHDIKQAPLGELSITEVVASQTTNWVKQQDEDRDALQDRPVKKDDEEPALLIELDPEPESNGIQITNQATKDALLVDQPVINSSPEKPTEPVAEALAPIVPESQPVTDAPGADAVKSEADVASDPIAQPVDVPVISSVLPVKDSTVIPGDITNKEISGVISLDEKIKLENDEEIEQLDELNIDDEADELSRSE